MAELTDQQILERANQAKRLLDDDLLKETMLQIEDSLVTRWKFGTTVEIREEAHAELAALYRITTTIRGALDNADFLKDQLEKQKRHEQ